MKRGRRTDPASRMLVPSPGSVTRGTRRPSSPPPPATSQSLRLTPYPTATPPPSPKGGRPPSTASGPPSPAQPQGEGSVQTPFPANNDENGQYYQIGAKQKEVAHKFLCTTSFRSIGVIFVLQLVLDYPLDHVFKWQCSRSHGKNRIRQFLLLVFQFDSVKC